MTGILSTHRIVMVRTAVLEFITTREQLAQAMPRYLQGNSAVNATVAIGREIIDAHALLNDIDDLIARSTGKPAIVRNNADLVSPAATGPTSEVCHYG